MSSVLLVEDDRTLADTIASLLPSEHRVSVAYDGESALAHAARFLPDAVLLDLGLPALDGFVVARRLREALGSAVHLIAYTARSDVTREQLTAAGFDGLIVKPATLDEIMAALRRAPAGAAQEARVPLPRR
ncbi:MAG TPA: response regulator [Casimicrobiaceae bacterium]|nr:response regulator [Casimicrobiaceae bacterium]